MWRAVAWLLVAPLVAAEQDAPEPSRRLGLVGEIASGLGRDPVHILPNTSSDVVSGLVEAFLHRQAMPEEERQCLVNGTGELAGDIMTVASHAVMIMQAVMGIRDDLPAPPASAEFKESPQVRGPKTEADEKLKELQQSGALVERRRLQGGALDLALGASQLFIDLGVSLKKMAILSHRITKDCLHGPAREALQRASENVRNIQYIGGHFLASGADIVAEIGDAIGQWNRGEYRDFGRSMGTALRKAVLANDTTGGLPEGPPDGKVLGNITVGLADGLLGRGFSLEVRMLDRPEATMHIDLRKCVGQNLFFFQSAWSATMYFFAQQAAQGEDDTSRYKEAKQRFGNQLAFTMMQLPHALKTCNIDQQQENAVMDAVRAFGAGTSLHFGVPGGHHFALPQVEAVIKDAVEHWRKGEWYSFGHDIGTLLQYMVLTIFPQKYSVDTSGHLQQKLAEATDPGPDGPQVNRGEVFAAVPAISLLLIALFVASCRRTVLLTRPRATEEPAQRDPEDIE